jgi:flavin reductase (DIM6/NTAB) family NADH-FMN oxidoreductase RutF
MFYDTQLNNHGLPFDPFKSCVIPRPIAWITSINHTNQVNLAPFSYFNAISDCPPMIMFSVSNKKPNGHEKDTLRNIEETKEFVVNISTLTLKEAMNLSSKFFEYGINEIEQIGLETLSSTLVKPPRIKHSPIHLECLHHQTIQLPVVDEKHTNKMIIGKVIGVHINDDIIIEGKIDVTKFHPLARLGYREYTAVESKFVMEKPR